MNGNGCFPKLKVAKLTAFTQFLETIDLLTAAQIAVVLSGVATGDADGVELKTVDGEVV